MKKDENKHIGRNEPCPCGSDKRYKQCHGQLPDVALKSIPKLIKEQMELHAAKRARQESQQGKGKPIISTEFNGYRFTAVGRQLQYSKAHKTFFDLLGSYIRSVLGSDWGNAEIVKPLEKRHQILQWYDAICALQSEHMKKPAGEIQSMPMHGVNAAYYGLAYNLYLLQHNVELQKYLVRRLKNPKSFYGAYYETYVAAWFILAGFKLELEDEEDPTRTHPEFIATRDGTSYSVEAKTRQPNKEHLDVGNQLYDALNIDSHHQRVVFIDMNVGKDIDFEILCNEVFASIKSREPKLTIQSKPAPPAHVFVTNQPYHLALNETKLPRVCLSVGFKIADFGNVAQFSTYTEAYKSRMKYAALIDVQKSMASYSIPATFDGEIPEFAFGEADRRFTIGERIEVADGVTVTIESGFVIKPEQKAYLVVVDAEGIRHLIAARLTDAEIAAYRSHPETFFGRIVPVSKNAEDPIDLYEFFIHSNKETPRERLLQIMKSAPDIEELKKLPDDEVLYTLAERLTYRAMQERRAKSP